MVTYVQDSNRMTNGLTCQDTFTQHQIAIVRLRKGSISERPHRCYTSDGLVNQLTSDGLVNGLFSGLNGLKLASASQMVSFL